MSEITDILEQQADLLFQNISSWERRTLEYIGARIKKTGKLSMADAKVINNIAIIEKDMEAIIKDLARVTGHNISEIRRIYSEVINSQHNANKVLYDYLKTPFIPFADDKRLQSMVRAYAKTTAETMINISKTKALGFVDEFGRFTDMKTTLHNTLSKAVMEVASGTTDFNTAMRRTVETLGGSGIRVNYGGGITRRLDSAVRQNILWGAKQASNEYNEMIGEELGCDGIEIDWHSNPRPSHEFMQGKQYSLSGKKTVNGVTYESAERALAALEDYGCLHFKTPIILGVSEPRFSEEELAELNRQNSEPITINGVTKSGYEWKQGMRRLESAVREQETIKATAKASGNNVLADECDERIKAFKNKYNEISNATGIAKQPNRMSASKAKNTLTSVRDGGIINKKLSDRAINIHNETENGVYKFDDIEKDLQNSKIGKDILEYIEFEGMFVTINYDLNSPMGIMGQIDDKDIMIFAQNCESLEDVADTLIHEVCHKKYNWRYTQTDEIKCYIMEKTHRNGGVEKSDIEKIIDFVKENYSDLPKGDFDVFGIQ